VEWMDELVVGVSQSTDKYLGLTVENAQLTTYI